MGIDAELVGERMAHYNTYVLTTHRKIKKRSQGNEYEVIVRGNVKA